MKSLIPAGMLLRLLVLSAGRGEFLPLDTPTDGRRYFVSCQH